jgi:hypothetical protein
MSQQVYLFTTESTDTAAVYLALRRALKEGGLVRGGPIPHYFYHASHPFLSRVTTTSVLRGRHRRPYGGVPTYDLRELSIMANLYLSEFQGQHIAVTLGSLRGRVVRAFEQYDCRVLHL